MKNAEFMGLRRYAGLYAPPYRRRMELLVITVYLAVAVANFVRGRVKVSGCIKHPPIIKINDISVTIAHTEMTDHLKCLY